MDEEKLAEIRTLISEFTPEAIAEMSEEELEKLEELIARLKGELGE